MMIKYNTHFGIYKSKVEDLVKQNTDGLIYDLNRDEATINSIFPENLIFNEIALINVLKFLHGEYLKKVGE